MPLGLSLKENDMAGKESIAVAKVCDVLCQAHLYEVRSSV